MALSVLARRLELIRWCLGCGSDFRFRKREAQWRIAGRDAHTAHLMTTKCGVVSNYPEIELTDVARELAKNGISCEVRTMLILASNR